MGDARSASRSRLQWSKIPPGLQHIYLYLSIYGMMFSTLQFPSDHGVLATTLEEL